PRRRYLVRDVRLEPNTFGLEINLPQNTLIDDEHAREVAMESQRQLQARGYPAAEVRPTLVEVKPGVADLHLKVIPGKPDKKKKREKLPLVTEGPKDLCRALLVERRDAQREGILDFSASFQDGHLTVDRGHPYRVRRIEFTGNHHFSDSTVRRH